jgi:putative phosphoribosyl transferase
VVQDAEGDSPRWIDVRISDGRATLPGSLALPRDARGMVVFAHGTGSGRHSSRNRRVAEALYGAAFGTLLVDLLTESESEDRSIAFDVALLGERLVQATHWLAEHRATGDLPIGYLGGSTGAAAGLAAAAAHGAAVPGGM